MSCHICGGHIPSNNNRAWVTLRPCVIENTETEIDLCRDCFHIIDVHIQRWRNNFHSYDMRVIEESNSGAFPVERWDQQKYMPENELL